MRSRPGAGRGPPDSCLAKAASLAADVVALIRALITAADVPGVLAGTRSLDSMEDAGILPHFAGIVVFDRYQNYFHPRWKHVAGNQARLAHILRDYEDCAESHRDAVWPVQAQRALRCMIHAWHAARQQGLPLSPMT